MLPRAAPPRTTAERSADALERRRRCCRAPPLTNAEPPYPFVSRSDDPRAPDDPPELVSRAATLPELRRRREDFHADIAKFKALIAQLREHHAKLAAKVDLRACEAGERTGALRALEGECAELDARVGAQELSADDAARMHAERERVHGAMADAQAARRAHEQALWEREMELSRSVEDLEAAAHAFNARLRALHVAPAGAYNAPPDATESLELVVRKERVDTSAAALLTPSVPDAVAPQLARLRDAVRRALCVVCALRASAPGTRRDQSPPPRLVTPSPREQPVDPAAIGLLDGS